MDTYAGLNDILVKLFREIMDIENKAIITSEYADITNNDMHVIEAIGIDEKKNMSTVAALLSVTVGSLTIAVNGLVRKGYVIRTRSEEDRRVVYISLSEKGEQAFRHHKRFHDEMIDAVVADLSDDERKILTKSLLKLDRWFKKKAEDNDLKEKK